MRTEDIAPFVAVGQELERRKVRLLQGEGVNQHDVAVTVSSFWQAVHKSMTVQKPHLLMKPHQLSCVRAAFGAQSHRSEPEPGPLSSVSATLPLSHTMIPTCCILRGRMESRTRDRFFTGECWQPALTEATLALRRCLCALRARTATRRSRRGV